MHLKEKKRNRGLNGFDGLLFLCDLCLPVRVRTQTGGFAVHFF